MCEHSFLESFSIGYMSVFMPVPYCFGCCSFVVNFEIGKHESCNFVILFQDCFDYLEFLEIPYEFCDGFFCFCKKKEVIVILVGIELYL